MEVEKVRGVEEYLLGELTQVHPITRAVSPRRELNGWWEYEKHLRAEAQG